MKKLIRSFCLLLFYNYSFCVASFALEQMILESIGNKSKYQSISKRQLTEGIDDDTSDVYLAERDLFETLKAKVGPEPVVATSTTTTTTSSWHGNGDNGNCSCRRKDHKDEEAIKKLIEKYGEKLLLPSLKKIDSRDLTRSKVSKTTIEEPRITTNSTTGPMKIPAMLNETHFELKEAEFQPNAKLNSIQMKHVCPHFKYIPELDIEKMVDVWELIYYKASEKLSCFKIYLKKTTPESRKQYKAKYSNFNETIDWQNCHLELNSIRRPREDRKHFLQGHQNSKGVLENIVLSESITNNTKTIILQEQSPDQWLVTKNLLLMRDCENGDVVIFSRLPSKPDRWEIEAAMLKFGEKDFKGTVACEEHNPNETYAPKKHDCLINKL